MYFIDENINTRNHISLMNYIYKIKCRAVITNAKQRFGKNIYKKEKKQERRLKNEKLKTRKSQKSRKSRKNYSEFSILPYSQTRRLRFKNLGIKFPRFLRYQRGSSLIVYEER